jgi:hypothetical protein
MGDEFADFLRKSRKLNRDGRYLFPAKKTGTGDIYAPGIEV